MNEIRPQHQFSSVGMTERELETIRVAETLSSEVLAKNAQRYDDDAAFPQDNFDAMREHGLTGVVVPERFGGLGLRPHAYAAFLRALSRGCASTAASFHMHNAVMTFLGILGTEEQQGHYFGKAVEGQLFGSWAPSPPPVLRARSH